MKKTWVDPAMDELTISFTEKNPTNNIYETDEWTQGENGEWIAWNGTASGPAIEAPLHQ